MLLDLDFSSVFQFGMDIATSMSVIGAAFMFIYNRRREKQKSLDIMYLKTLKETIDNFKNISSKLYNYQSEFEEIFKLIATTNDPKWFIKEKKLMHTKYSTLHRMAKVEKYHFLIKKNFDLAISTSNEVKSMFKNKKLNALNDQLPKFEEQLYKIYEEIGNSLNSHKTDPKSWDSKFEEAFLKYLKKLSSIHVSLNKIYFDFLKSL